MNIDDINTIAPAQCHFDSRYPYDLESHFELAPGGGNNIGGHLIAKGPLWAARVIPRGMSAGDETFVLPNDPVSKH